ncbi:MAG: LysR substrate-binding domain-containing protein, partial [Gaiellaceae bacterium]
PQVLSELASERDVTAELISANSELVRELVRDGRSDLGIASIDPYALYADGLEERIVWRDELVVVVPPGHPWEDLDEIPAEDFAATAVMQRDPWSNSSRIVTATLERLGFERLPPTAAIGSTAGVVALARAQGMPALISIMAARANPEQQFEIRRVEGLRFGLEYALVWAGPMLDLRAEVQAVAGHIMHLPFARPRVTPAGDGGSATPLSAGAQDRGVGSDSTPQSDPAPAPPAAADRVRQALHQTGSERVQRPSP